MKLLHIDSSALADHSVTRRLTAAIVGAWQQQVPDLVVTYRDLDTRPLPHLTATVMAGQDPALAAALEQALQEFIEADVLVLGAPMYNYGIPSTLKAWIDHVTVAGRTFRYTAPGQVQGLVTGKQVIVASAQGGEHAGTSGDFQEAYLKYVLGFLGITDVEFVRAEGVAYSPQHRETALENALAAIPSMLRQVA